ncbi:MAG TPA: dephospho-CoA kinase [Candidatus Cybelea sp.]|nr:dephospho-CoA kinase [Candidatus Cybelea sp.]
MLRIGLTGGIATGKSTVADMLRTRDCMVLDLDPIGHAFFEPGQTTYDQVVQEFGREILTTGGAVDRSKLAAIVFADGAKRNRLNAILHPLILDVAEKWFAALDRQGGLEFAVVEAALIMEAGYHKQLDRVVVCWCGPEQQLERLIARGLSRAEALARLGAQMPIDEKRKLADDVIDCSRSMYETEKQVTALIGKLKKLATAERNIS